MGILGKKKEIGPDTILQRKKDILFRQIDGEVVMLSIDNGEYYGLDRVGARIWDIIEKKVFFAQLIAQLMDEYNISKADCEEDTLIFLLNLYNKNLINIID